MICGLVQAFAIMPETACLLQVNAVPAFSYNQKKQMIYLLRCSKKNSSGFSLMRISQWWGAVIGWQERQKQVL